MNDDEVVLFTDRFIHRWAYDFRNEFPVTVYF